MVLRRLEEAEVGPAEEGQQTSRGCLVVLTNMLIEYDGEASGGVDSTTASGSLGRGERSLGKPVRFRKSGSTVDVIQAVVNIATNARKGTGKRKRFCALISIDIRNAFNTAR